LHFRPVMENAEIAQALSEIAGLLELTGGNPFRARAYSRAAQIVDGLAEPIEAIWKRGELTDLPGIGERIAAHVGELIEKGTCAEREQLARKVPPGLPELLRIEGMGPKSVAAVWKSLGITQVDALEEACRSGTILEVPRMGRVRVKGLLEAIRRHRARRGRTPLYRALPAAETIIARLRKAPAVTAAEIAGSIRRRCETIGDIDLLVAATDPAPVTSAFTHMAEVAQIVAEGPTRSTVRLRSGLHADLRVVEPKSFGAALQYLTGSKAHSIALRKRGLRRGLKLSEYGVFDRRGRRKGGDTEEQMYRALGLPWIPPELREDRGEIEAAEHGGLPLLVEEKDVLGDLHVHSKASSDGHSTVEELADAARELGRRYLAITDHSRSRPLGLDAERLAQHVEHIRGLTSRDPVLLAGIEVDILPDGSLDLPVDALAPLQCVVASIHAHFNDPSPKMTERMVRAMRSGVVHVLGHPSGRQLGMRDPYAFDLARVLEIARETGVALEVNAQPERLDLSDQACRLAKAAGVPVVISSDAHHVSQLANLRYGVWVARRGWLEKGDVLNTLPLEALQARLRRKGPVIANGSARRPRRLGAASEATVS